MRELKIDPELRDLLPPLTSEEYKQLEKNIVDNGFDGNFPIMEWQGFIVDGHNRYDICRKHNIEPIIGTLAYETKEEVMEWMLDIQLGRRNLTPIQKIAITEKYRPIYEKQAKENQRLAGIEYGNGGTKLPQNFGEASNKKKLSKDKEVNSKLAKIANVNPETYRQAKRVLDSNNEDIKQRVLSGKTSIYAGYKELTGKKENKKEEAKNEIPSTSQIQPPKSKVSEEVKQICEDLKTEKTKEYLDSIWDYKVSIIECMNADFDMYYDGFVSILNDMENRVTKSELDECIKNAGKNVEKLLAAIELAKNTTLKTEE